MKSLLPLAAAEGGGAWVGATALAPFVAADFGGAFFAAAFLGGIAEGVWGQAVMR